MNWLRSNRELIIVLGSLLVQIPLAFFLGHYYDERVYMATGYFVSQGLNPYAALDVANALAHPSVGGVIPSIGYPPLSTLLLGFIFRSSYAIIPNIYVYNFAIKIPFILANIGLAYAVKLVLLKTKVKEGKAQWAWLFILFNPFVLLSTIAWGSFDTMVALLCFASIYFFSIDKFKMAALSMAIGMTLKPIALPLVGLPLLASSKLPLKKIEYFLTFIAVFLASFFGPFILFGWDFPGIDKWDVPFIRAGGMTPFNIIELFQAPVLPGGLEFLGFLWIPVLLVGYYLILKARPRTLNELAGSAVVLMLIFFLSRTWLSEPNINIIFPFMLLLVTGTREKSFSKFHFLWIIPLIFMFLNFSFPQLFFLPFPGILNSLASIDQHIGTTRFLSRFLITVLWQVFAWGLVANILSQFNKKHGSNVGEINQ